LSRYFHKVPGGYQISKTLRDSCVFAVQNITKDPPFSRLDLLSCRNLLIYLGATLQKKVLQIFHYALVPDGFLLLGSSETIGTQTDLFSCSDKKNKLFKKKTSVAKYSRSLVFRHELDHAQAIEMPVPMSPKHEFDLNKEAEGLLLQTYAPPGVIVDKDHVVVRFIGRTWPYIEHSGGVATLNLYKLAHSDLAIELRAALHAVKRNGNAVRKENVRIKVDGKETFVDIHVMPIGGGDDSEENALVMFESPQKLTKPDEATDSKDATGNRSLKSLQNQNEELSNELSTTREYMQSIVEEQEGTNEELRSANEEIQSTNEELQSTNEELETAKEELQSSNEELATVNEELENRNEDLARLNDDLSNLLASVNLPILMLGSDLCIRQFTFPAKGLLNLIDTDVGRPINNIKPNLDLPDLEKQALQVVETLNTISMEVQDSEGHWYSVCMRPYKTLDNRIDGVVVTFIDINDLKLNLKLQEELTLKLQEKLERETRLAAVVSNSSDAITLQDLSGKILAWNPSASKIYGYSEEEALNMNVSELVAQKDLPQLKEMLARMGQGMKVEPMEIDRIAKNGDILRIWIVATALVNKQGKVISVATTERLIEES
jgi:two-component system CheB/CheR fusion protein